MRTRGSTGLIDRVAGPSRPRQDYPYDSLMKREEYGPKYKPGGTAEAAVLGPGRGIRHHRLRGPGRAGKAAISASPAPQPRAARVVALNK